MALEPQRIDNAYQFGLEELDRLFPFHFVFDRSLIIQHCGSSLLKIEPTLNGSLLNEYFKIRNPRIEQTYDAIYSRANALHSWELIDKIKFRGQIMTLRGSTDLIFIGSPSLHTASQLNELGLTASEFAHHDCTLDHLFMLQAQATSIADSKRMVETLQRSVEEKANLEALQADLAFELNIAYDLKIRFRKEGTILDIQTSSNLPFDVDCSGLIGQDVYKDVPYLGKTLQKTVASVRKNDDKLAFHFEVNSGRDARYLEARLALAPNDVYLLLANDVTEQHRLKLQLERRANFDSLTELPNRSFFFERARNIVNRTRNDGLLYSMLTIDLDNFKNINDSYGHSAGDFTLETVSRILLSNTRLEDVAARLGGDEFALFFSGKMTREEIIGIAKRICNSCQETIKFQNNEFRCGCSIGIAFSVDPDLELNMFRNQADLAMYQSKEDGKGTVTVYQEGMYEKHRHFLSLRDALSKAIEANALTLVYQPVVKGHSGAVVGFEVLARWYHPEQGHIPPDQFISIAEESGLMVPLGRALMREAIKTWSNVTRHHPQASSWTLALNISTYQLYDESLAEDLQNYLEIANIEPSQIVLEITETALIRDIEQAVALIVDLKNIGFTIALDDFGTGFSSLSYLDQLPLDVIKIDRSFVMKIESEDTQAPLIEAVVGIANVMNLEIIAEGVETEVQQTVLNRLGCEFAQGYLYSKPVNESELLDYCHSLKELEPDNAS